MRGFSNYAIWCVDELLAYLGSLLWQQGLLTQYIHCNFNSKLPSKEQAAFMDLNSTVTMSLRNKALYILQPYKIDSLRTINASFIDLLCAQYILQKAHNYRLSVEISFQEISIRYVCAFIVFKLENFKACQKRWLCFAFSLPTDVSAALRWWLEHRGGWRGPDVSASLFSRCQSHLYWPLNCVHTPTPRRTPTPQCPNCTFPPSLQSLPLMNDSSLNVVTAEYSTGKET